MEKNYSSFAHLSDEEIYERLRSGFSTQNWLGKRVLVLIPDTTRTAPVGKLFRMINDLLLKDVNKLDYLVALGTHKGLTPEEQQNLIGMSAAECKKVYPNVEIFNHEWDKPENLVILGTLSANEISKASNCLLSEEIPVQVNRKLLDYDLVMICGPVFPHEVAGFSGGNKYLFPGVSGPEMINFTHWLGALITSYEIIGTIRTPVRDLIDSAASLLPTPLLYCSFVTDKNGIFGLVVGNNTESWREAAGMSASVHVRYLQKPLKKVISILPEMYDELWTGAKGMYKLEPVVADGGELILYAPHIQEVSFTHGKVINEIGYHIRDYFLENWENFKDYPLSVLAHSTHLKGQGHMHLGQEKPRINVSLATGISPEVCKQINLTYCDPGSLVLEKIKNDKSDEVLLVENAGEVLYRLEKN